MDTAATRTGGGRLALVVATSLLAGLVAAGLLASAPWVPPTVDAVTGAVLGGFALGWATLAGLSSRFTDRPQRWALVPAAYLALGGLVLLTVADTARPVLDTMWPPTLLALVLWAAFRTRRRLPGRLARGMVYAVLAVLLLASVGGGYDAVSRAAGSPDVPMPGALVDVGGHRLHLTCTGTGGPTVVLEAGGGETAASFDRIAPAVARTTRVCAYDRAGHGWSEPADHPQDGAQVADDLHTLLDRAGVPGPYVLVGHSFGGLYVLAFADRHPEDVAGMVLVDTTQPEPAADAGAAAYDDATHPVATRVSALLAVTARLGIPRLVDRVGNGDLLETTRDALSATTVREDHVRSTIEEYLTAGASAAQAAEVTDLGDRPLVVLTAGEGSDAAWVAGHEELAALSTRGEHRVVDGATHTSLILDEHDSRATVRGVLDVVSALR